MDKRPYGTTFTYYLSDDDINKIVDEVHYDTDPEPQPSFNDLFNSLVYTATYHVKDLEDLVFDLQDEIKHLKNKIEHRGQTIERLRKELNHLYYDVKI